MQQNWYEICLHYKWRGKKHKIECEICLASKAQIEVKHNAQNPFRKSI